MCGTPTEVCVSIASHPGDKEFRPGQQLSVKSVEVNNSDAKCSKESEETSEDSFWSLKVNEQRVREHRLLVVSFIKWRDKLWRAEQVPGGRKHKWQEPSPGKACHRWRVAARGQQALRLGSVTTVKQACNYWTRAAAFSQCLRQRSTLIGVRKSRKMSLSWPTKSRRGREEDSAPTGLFPSAIQRWLMIYRSQNRAERLLERPDVVGPSRAHARIQETAEVDLEEGAKKWLG
ncbi:uncharacterized protein LOC121344122 [Onychostruthus taczanowskii]|uniref:uncharacterized protein LOC121344122 n=1 Tax=Onychostruthus taczanowskii TaxID=356909 RepID=UPI001B80B829|nr:uncharacterized protein LOC121344122 [Onychostruthus taczanowskii]